jgi:hypothetical protein
MRARITSIIFVILCTLGIAYGEDKPTSLSDARAAVEANLKTPEGKAYEEKMGKEFPEKHLGTLRQCRQSTGGDLQSFWLLMKLGQNGAVQEVLLYPSTKLGQCMRETLLQGSFSPPPHPAYWESVYLKLGSN